MMNAVDQAFFFSSGHAVRSVPTASHCLFLCGHSNSVVRKFVFKTNTNKRNNQTQTRNKLKNQSIKQSIKQSNKKQSIDQAIN